MAWNEPGGSDNNQNDPWSRKPKNQGPPDLEQALKKLRKKVMQVFSGKKSQIATPSPNGSGVKFSVLATGIAVLVLLLWLASGIFIVRPAEEAVVLRFGKYKETLGPGLHWIARFIDSKYVLNVKQVQTLNYSAEMLTRDTNIIEVQLAVQYSIASPNQFLFNVINAVGSLEQATASAVRQVIGQTDLDAALTGGRREVRDQIMQTLLQTMQGYQTGIEINDVNLQLVKPPKEVAGAFDDVIKAHEDEKRYVKEATAYAAGVEPVALGQAARLKTLAEADAKQMVFAAEGSVASYNAVLPEYKNSPAVTRERLYLDAMQSVLSKSSKVLVDTKGGNLFYLPLDKIIQQYTGEANSADASNASPPFAPASSQSASRANSRVAARNSEVSSDFINNFQARDTRPAGNLRGDNNDAN